MRHTEALKYQDYFFFTLPTVALAVAFSLYEKQNRKENHLTENSRNFLKGREK